MIGKMIGKTSETELKKMYSDQVKDAAMRVLVGPEQGWESHVMRVIELGPNGYSPEHSHPWAHINYILEGEGFLMMSGEDTAVSAGSYAYVPGGTHHQFKNAADKPFKFICIVSVEGHQ